MSVHKNFSAFRYFIGIIDGIFLCISIRGQRELQNITWAGTRGSVLWNFKRSVPHPIPLSCSRAVRRQETRLDHLCKVVTWPPADQRNFFIEENQYLIYSYIGYNSIENVYIPFQGPILEEDQAAIHRPIPVGRVSVYWRFKVVKQYFPGVELNHKIKIGEYL